VLSRVVKVAPTDSGVLITGETGTGKELIARAIHKRSRRSERAFVSVNCAALAPSLISSELFGHEKGAFTGATQRRRAVSSGECRNHFPGRSRRTASGCPGRTAESAARAGIRAGRRHGIHQGGCPCDCRNQCNLEAAKANGTFRSDLFYRLNVFPIEAPPLRERKDDVLMLLEYFVHRYAQKGRQEFRKDQQENPRTISIVRLAWQYPRATECRREVGHCEFRRRFGVDEAWLSTNAGQAPWRHPGSENTDGNSSPERQIIEAALAESRGRISGPKGAAAKLQIPPSTLESKLKKFKISKTYFKFGEGCAVES